MLVLPITKKWFDMILSGEKKEEYREIKSYYKTRIQNEAYVKNTDGKLVKGQAELEYYLKEKDINKALRKGKKLYLKDVIFRNGYSNISRSFTANLEVSIGKGKEKWGAKPNQEYYVLKVQHIY